MSKKPSYATALQHFKVIYGNGSAEHAANTWKGLVKVNFEPPTGQGRFENACAIYLWELP